MLDWTFLISILLSVIALLLSLYREFQGPDISLMNKPAFKLTDDDFEWQDKYIPNWFNLSEVSLIFANYGGKGGAILGIKIIFSPAEAMKEFFDGFSSYFRDLPITIKDGETCTVKFRPDIRTKNWKKHKISKLLQNGHSLVESIDKATAEGREEFERFCSFLAENEEIGEVSCNVSLTVGRVWPKVKDIRVFRKIKVKNEYKKTINLLKKKLQNWDQLEPTRTELVNSFMRGIRNLISELKANLKTVHNMVSEENISQSKLRIQNWEDFNKERYRNEAKWYLIDRETDLKENLEGAYRQILSYNARIQDLLYLGDRRTEDDFKKIFIARVKLEKQIDTALKKLRTLQREGFRA